MNEDLAPAPSIGLNKRKNMGVWLIPIVLLTLAAYVAFALTQRRQAQTELAAVREETPRLPKPMLPSAERN